MKYTDDYNNVPWGKKKTGRMLSGQSKVKVNCRAIRLRLNTNTYFNVIQAFLSIFAPTVRSIGHSNSVHIISVVLFFLKHRRPRRLQLFACAAGALVVPCCPRSLLQERPPVPDVLFSLGSSDEPLILESRICSCLSHKVFHRLDSPLPERVEVCFPQNLRVVRVNAVAESGHSFLHPLQVLRLSSRQH